LVNLNRGEWWNVVVVACAPACRRIAPVLLGRSSEPASPGSPEYAAVGRNRRPFATKMSVIEKYYSTNDSDLRGEVIVVFALILVIPDEDHTVRCQFPRIRVVPQGD
jgi:hypothetical protein